MGRTIRLLVGALPANLGIVALPAPALRKESDAGIVPARTPIPGPGGRRLETVIAKGNASTVMSCRIPAVVERPWSAP
jgi:hypothetical protein